MFRGCSFVGPICLFHVNLRGVPSFKESWKWIRKLFTPFHIARVDFAGDVTLTRFRTSLWDNHSPIDDVKRDVK